MASDIPSEVISTLQSAHIDEAPDPSRDINPSTTASKKVPVQVTNVDSHFRVPGNLQSRRPSSRSDKPFEIPVSILQPTSRHANNNLPPLPDFRFEQSYLASIQNCKSNRQIAWITFQDHVFKPLAQGVVWHLLTFGWRTWNRSVKFRGRGLGARLRRWWWGVNNWEFPTVGRKEKAWP